MVEKEAYEDEKYAAELTEKKDARLPLPLMIAAWSAIVSSCCLFFFAVTNVNRHFDPALWYQVALPLGIGGVALRLRMRWAWWLLAICAAGGTAVITAYVLFLWRTRDLTDGYISAQFGLIGLLSPLSLLMLICLLIHPPSKWPLSDDEYQVHSDGP